MLVSDYETPLVDAKLPDSSMLRRVLKIPMRHVAIRPYSPAGFTKSGIFLARNPKFPKVWGYLLAVTPTDKELMPELELGAMVTYQRFSDEEIGEDEPQVVRYMGHTLQICIVHVHSLNALINPPPIPAEY